MEKNIIFIKNYRTKSFIGIYPEEKETKQRIKISVKLEIRRNEITDKISSTVCYKNVLDVLENIDKFGHINLVETLANKLAEEFMKIKNINKIIIKISKCEISKEGTDIGFTLKKNIK